MTTIQAAGPAGVQRPEPGLSRTRLGLIFVTISLALLLSGIDQTIVASALPEMAADLDTGIEWISWTITIYALGQVMVMPLAGRLSDLYGRKRVFLIAVGLFAVAGIACGFAWNIGSLIAFRALQAIGGAAFMPSASGIIADSFGANRDRALGLFSSIFPLGAVLGPVLGGVVVTLLSWRLVFAIGVPIALVLIVLGVIVLPNTRGRANESLDILGMLLLSGLILSAMLGIALLGDSGRSLLDPAFLVAVLLAIALLVGFVLRVRAARHPFIPPRFLAGRGFGLLNIMNFMHGAAAMGFASLVPVYAHYRFGMGALQAGSLLSARAVGMIVVSAVAVVMLRRTGYRIPMAIGALITAAGLLGLAIVPVGVDPYPWLFAVGGVAGVGIGMSVPAANNAVLKLVPDSVAAVAGVRGMFRHAGSIASVSVSTAIVARSMDGGAALAIVFSVFAGIMLLTVPLAFLVPNHKGSW